MYVKKPERCRLLCFDCREKARKAGEPIPKPTIRGKAKGVERQKVEAS